MLKLPSNSLSPLCFYVKYLPGNETSCFNLHSYHSNFYTAIIAIEFGGVLIMVC